ncbi:MAG: fibronectin type III domain-containing protein [Anaerolineales bacterium]|nr:fibronectin type III domain-containing protein [Anaerolineales bacterium]
MAGHLYANWSASDPDSAITLYQYAIGTTAGGAEVVNWTNTSETSFDRDDLGLTAGQVYYISVRARNEGGLWSGPGTPPGLTAGSGVCMTNSKVVYLPMVGR